MKNYFDPEMEIIFLPENDVIVTSPGDCMGDTGELDPIG